MNNTTRAPKHVFTRYQTFLIAVLAIIQFTIILDFMVIAPLGAQMMRIMKISPTQFGWIVSGYAFSAAISGIFTAGFADKFDRKKMLLFFYCGFVLGTFYCGVASEFWFLFFARVITGMFGGVMGSITMAIVADTFAMEVRGRVMGYVQMAFSVSQVLGIPLGIFLANRLGWHAPFLLIGGMCLIIGIVIVKWMKPITGHLKTRIERNAFAHLAKTLSNKSYLRAFAATVFLSTGGFMMMPFSSAFYVHNVGVSEAHLPIIYIASGVCGLVMGPLIGKWSDKIGKFRLFLFGSVLATIMVLINTHLGITPLWLVNILNMFMFLSVASRMIPTSALISAVPAQEDRGAFMSLNSSIQQMGGGFASLIGGLIIAQGKDGHIFNYDVLGYITIGAFWVCGILLYAVTKHLAIRSKDKEVTLQVEAQPEMA